MLKSLKQAKKQHLAAIKQAIITLKKAVYNRRQDQEYNQDNLIINHNN
jgi:hypothetical protein